MVRIERCVCMDMTFAELLAIARREGLDADGLERETGCGSRCGMCPPYIEEALRTGRVVFHEILVQGRSQSRATSFTRGRSGARARGS
jgi:bacterioferritin-associated ferredoxin